MKHREMRLYNVFFPFWMLMYWPQVWLLTLPLNLVVDWLVLRVTLHCLGAEDKHTQVRRSLLRLWVGGFAADLLAAIPMALVLVPSMMDTVFGAWWNAVMVYGVMHDPFSSPWSLLWVAGCVALGGALVYVLAVSWGLRKTTLTLRQRCWTALVLAIVTAPWFFLVPMAWFY